MDSTTSNSYLNLIQWLLGGGFIASLIGYLWNKYFRVRPKLEISFVHGGSTQSAEGLDRLKFKWRPKLVLYNDSIYRARRVKLLASSNITDWKFTSKLPEYIEPDTKVEWSLEFNKLETLSTLFKLCGENALREYNLAEMFFPHAIGEAQLIFSYDSDKDKTFYSKIHITKNNILCSHHRVRPKLSSE